MLPKRARKASLKVRENQALEEETLLQKVLDAEDERYVHYSLIADQLACYNFAEKERLKSRRLESRKIQMPERRRWHRLELCSFIVRLLRRGGSDFSLFPIVNQLGCSVRLLRRGRRDCRTFPSASQLCCRWRLLRRNRRDYKRSYSLRKGE